MALYVAAEQGTLSSSSGPLGQGMNLYHIQPGLDVVANNDEIAYKTTRRLIEGPALVAAVLFYCTSWSA